MSRDQSSESERTPRFRRPPVSADSAGCRLWSRIAGGGMAVRDSETPPRPFETRQGYREHDRRSTCLPCKCSRKRAPPGQAYPPGGVGPSWFDRRNSSLFRGRPYSNLLVAVGVGEFPIVFADIFEQFVVGHPLVRNGVGPGFFKRNGIVDRDFIPHNVRSHQSDAFFYSHARRVRHVLVTHILLHANRIDG